ncbi:MAG: class I SAM-dependent methyltransferase, partial [Tissierellia bacterium]|nr:class I SAM-dependent methyltransferase [Tissierellia bacterium]
MISNSKKLECLFHYIRSKCNAYYYDLLKNRFIFGIFNNISLSIIFPMLYKGCGLELPQNKKYIRKINKAAEELYKKILILDVNKLEIGDYNKRYLSNIKKSLYNQLQRYAYILIWILSENNYELEKIKFLDYGGGTGVLSLLAKQLGITEVYYNDIYDISCKDAKKIADALHLPKRDYIEGDLDNVIQYCNKTHIYFNGIGSYDVIEHIYDIDDFFMNIHRIADETCTMFMCTSANSYNKMIKKRLIKGHRIAETMQRK